MQQGARLKGEEDGYYNQFDPRYYLERYFGLSAVSPSLGEWVRILSQFPDNTLSVLNFGGGPDLLPLLYAAQKAREYVHSDYARSNVAEVERWLGGDPSAFSWRRHVSHCLELENCGETVEARERRMREVVKAVVHCDITAERVLPPEYVGPYDYVVCTGVLDCVCTSEGSFGEAVRKLSGLVKAGGHLHVEMSYETEDAKCSTCYRVGDVVYDKELSLKMPSIIDAVKAEGFTIVHVFPYVEDNEATVNYKDNIVMVVAKKNIE